MNGKASNIVMRDKVALHREKHGVIYSAASASFKIDALANCWRLLQSSLKVIVVNIQDLEILNVSQVR